MRFRGLLLVAFWQCSNMPADARPPKPSGDPTTSADLTTFAVDRIFLGDSNRSGTSSNTAWMDFGYDIDEHITFKGSTDVCTAVIKTNQIDGLLGIDNEWGAVLRVIVQVGLAAPAISDDVTGLIDTGAWTLLLQTTGLNGKADETATALSAQIFIGAATSSPAFDSSTDWPVTPSSLNDGTTIASGARVHFDTVYVANGTIVATDASQPLTIPLVLLIHDVPPDGGAPKPPRPAFMSVRISRPTVTWSTTGEDGVIAGVMLASDVSAAATQLSHQLGGSLCGGAGLSAILEQCAEAVDILDDGTNHPGVACTATSIGLGFHAKRVANPTTVGQDPPPFVDPCPGDAGAD